jgi:hypothetical protein
MESLMAEAVVFKTLRKRLFLGYSVHRTPRMTYPVGLTWDNAQYTGKQLAVCTYPPRGIARD